MFDQINQILKDGDNIEFNEEKEGKKIFLKLVKKELLVEEKEKMFGNKNQLVI